MSLLEKVLNGAVDSIEEQIKVSHDNENCVECEDHPKQIYCADCKEDFCSVCFVSVHRKGTRLNHTTTQLTCLPVKPSLPNPSQDTAMETENEEMEKPIFEHLEQQVDDTVLNRSKFIPLRLTFEERKELRLLEAALNVSEYTDKIDILSYTSKPKRIVGQIKELCATLSGLVLATDYPLGQSLFANRDFSQNAALFQHLFEIGRRHKIMNPEKMRGSYGKLVFMLQDAQIQEVRELLDFDCVVPIKTVHSVLEGLGALEMLKDPLIVLGTAEISSIGKSRYQVQKEIQMKERAIQTLSRKYSRGNTDILQQCLYSIGDNNSFLSTNRDPCDKMIGYLKALFDPVRPSNGASLSIQSGSEGARLSHGHEKQYQYVLQSLSLWREVLHDMFMLWTLAEDDLLNSENDYRLRDTGQGLNRVQAAPRVSRMMHMILHRAQKQVGSWVGSSVIHLGDHNVPNALVFIDKYTQIYRILLPIVTCLEKLDSLASDDDLKAYIDSAFDGVPNAKLLILSDFFRHAFDGSGADNFFDAGSCIDGRLTSAWNWCSKLEKKSYHPLFLLTGFIGFDGQF